ncbi:TonB-dependent receptor [Zoogloea sp.]|uniref:TonB-dependent receptor plug domain-containing protein n=1 Tax=Zoogloea sp. TaxID=49181 RepID=UPI001AD305B4|nr:TonB-dependent receptor [Zoogloea sp.]MBN8284312.1 TonB-dependent receptor [Zoogloea sp.]
MPTHLATPRTLILRRLATQACTLLLTLSTQALAAAPPDASEATYLADLPVVLSATRLQQARADTPGSVTVIDRHMIRAAGVRDIHELFMLVPGFQVGMHTGNRPLVTYHGLSDEAPRRMLVQVDGRSVYSPYFIAGVEWNQLGVDIDDIERIEVFRGSNSAAYGSNAFLGVANIITRAPSETRGTSLRYRAGDGGVNDVAVRHGQRIGDVDLRLTAARNHDSGFNAINDWRKAELATLRADWAINHDHVLEFQAGWTNNDLGTGKDDNATDPERASRITTSFGLLRWRHVPAPDEELSVTWYHQEENGRDRYALSVPVSSRQSGLPVSIGIPFDFDYGFRAVRDDLEIQRVTSPAAGLRAVLGAGMREDRLDAPLRFNSSERVRSGVNRAFATLEWRASPQWLFNAGFMVEDNSLTGTSLAPRASANYHMTENQTLRFAVNRSYRSPIAFEQKSSMIFSNSAPVVTPLLTIPAGTPISQTFRPSPGLRAERITTYEMGYLAELRPLHASLDARLFLERARDLIEMRLENSSVGLLPRNNTRYFANSGEADIRGLEVVATWRPTTGTWLSLQHTELRIDGPGNPATASGAQPSAWVANSAPRHSSALFGAWEFHPRWQVSVARRWVGGMSWYSDAAHRVGMYRQLDVQLSHRLPPDLLRGEVSVTARNIDGDDETFAPGASWWGSRIFGTLQVEF